MPPPVIFCAWKPGTCQAQTDTFGNGSLPLEFSIADFLSGITPDSTFYCSGQESERQIIVKQRLPEGITIGLGVAILIVSVHPAYAGLATVLQNGNFASPDTTGFDTGIRGTFGEHWMGGRNFSDVSFHLRNRQFPFVSPEDGTTAPGDQQIAGVIFHGTIGPGGTEWDNARIWGFPSLGNVATGDVGKPFLLTANVAVRPEDVGYLQRCQTAGSVFLASGTDANTPDTIRGIPASVVLDNSLPAITHPFPFANIGTAGYKVSANDVGTELFPVFQVRVAPGGDHSGTAQGAQVVLDGMALTEGWMFLPTESTWIVDASGGWNVVDNWDPVVPDSERLTAIFGNVITSTQTVFTNTAVSVKGVRFDNTNTYVIAGHGSVNLVLETAPAIGIEVSQASREFQVDVNVQTNTVGDVASGATSNAIIVCFSMATHSP